MTRKIGFVCEAQADLAIGSHLIDRVIRSGAEWVAEIDPLDHLRRFVGHNDESEFVAWSRIDDVARALGIRVRGSFDDTAGMADAKAARRAIFTMRTLHSELAAVVLVRDQDNQLERRDGLNQGREAVRSIPVVIGLAIRAREAWVISGFDPRSEAEQERMQEVTADAGFDPRMQSHRLTTDTAQSADRKAKRILDVLTSGNWERQAACWEETPLSILRERGRDNGLADFLDEIEQILVPVIIEN